MDVKKVALEKLSLLLVLRLAFLSFFTKIERWLIKLQDKLGVYSHIKWVKETQDFILEDQPKQFIFVVDSLTEGPSLSSERTFQSIQNQLCATWIYIERHKEKVVKVLLSSRRTTEACIELNESLDNIIPYLVSNIKDGFLVYLMAGDEIHPRYCQSIQQHTSDIIYTDQAIISEKGEAVTHPFFKPDWSPELWLGVDLLYGAAFSISLVREIIQNRRFCNRDLIASCVFSATSIEHVPEVLIRTKFHPWQQETLLTQHSKRVKDYLELMGLQNVSISRRANKSLNPQWNIKTERISIIIPTKNHAKILKQCISSILNTTDYPSYEIILVDNKSDDPEVLQYYESLKGIKIISLDQEFNFSKACNLGASIANGEYFLFLNNDIEVMSSNWLFEMIRYAQLPGVGVVGAKLLYPNFAIQHIGIIIGLRGHAFHVFMGQKAESFTPFGYIEWQRNFLAVTGACMMIPRKLFSMVGGFDETFTLALSDIDICLRLSKHGYRAVVVPDPIIIHHEGASRGKYIPPADLTNKIDIFLDVLERGDPYYNKNLSCASQIPTLKRPWELSQIERLEATVFACQIQQKINAIRSLTKK